MLALQDAKSSLKAVSNDLQSVRPNQQLCVSRFIHA